MQRYMSLVRKNPVFGVSDQVHNKPGCAATDRDDKRLEKGLYHLCSENKGTDQLHGYRAADLCLCFFCIIKRQIFFMV